MTEDPASSKKMPDLHAQCTCESSINVSVLDIVRVHALRDDENLGDKGELVPHADGAAALNLALRYLEQQATATPADIMFMTR
ncbi:hypothetical protein J6590_012190, partial [Homalodisca vitripennis]